MSELPVILYIEDNRDNQRLVRRVLEAHRYTVLLAEDGPLGISLARETSPSLILVDINIPGLDGFETTTRLRSMQHLKHVPIVAVTAHATVDSRERSLVAGCDGYLLKPIDVRALPEQVGEFIAGKREAVPQEHEARLLREHTERVVERLEQQVRQLRSANGELQELDRLRRHFLASLSHELRTPLTSVKGYLELLDLEALGPLLPAQREALGVVGRNIETLARQVNNLLYLQEVRGSELQLRPIELSCLVRRLVEEFVALAASAGVTLRHELPAERPSLAADALALEQALRHLLDNAIRYSGRGGVVSVTLREDETRALIVVEDSGVGLAPDQLEKIFLPFYRGGQALDSNITGTGVGLAIVKHVIEAHDGQITVRSEPEGGTRFTVMLPRRSVPNPAS
jgi:signal transduction histidine kinase